MVEADLPGLTSQVGGAIGGVFDAAAAWIARYWIRRVGREPRDGELEPITRACWEAGRRTGAAEYLQAIEELQRFARGVAGFLGDVDTWLTPTMSAPPGRIGELVSTDDDPYRVQRLGGATVAYPLVVANITGNPGMSVPLWRNAEGMPVGVHFLGRFGDEATLIRLAAQLEAARPPAVAPMSV